MTNENNVYENAIEKIRKMAVEGMKVEPYETDDGQTFLFARNPDGSIEVKALAVNKVFKPDTMQVNTLTAFVNYIKAGIENGEIRDRLYINITSPTEVYAVTPVNEFGDRVTIVYARRYSFEPFNFGYKQDFENFVVALRSKFAPSDGVQGLLECLKKVTKNNDVSTEDNGVTQVVTAKNGLHLDAGVQIQPIWALKPHRTFTEIEQPESLFLLRMTQSGDSTQYALHETDGRAWAVTAMHSIGEWLRERLNEEIESGDVFVL